MNFYHEIRNIFIVLIPYCSSTSRESLLSVITNSPARQASFIMYESKSNQLQQLQQQQEKWKEKPSGKTLCICLKAMSVSNVIELFFFFHVCSLFLISNYLVW